MWLTTFLIAAWLTITPPAGFVAENTSVMLFEFSKPMSANGLFAQENYSIVDDIGNSVPIYKIELVSLIDGINIPEATLVAVLIPQAKYKTCYTATVYNLTDINGHPVNPEKNSAWFYNNGYAPNLEASPKLLIIK